MRQLVNFVFCVLAIFSINNHAADKRILLWGDTHLHTSYSSDAFVNSNTTADPETAYRYASGLPAVHPYHRARVRIETPLDFLVVSDHAELLGVIRKTTLEGPDTTGLDFLSIVKAKIAAWILQYTVENNDGMDLFSRILPEPIDPRIDAARTLEEGIEGVSWIPQSVGVQIDTWKNLTDLAEEYNRPGEFSTLIGWEWSAIPGGANLHRVVISDASNKTAQKFQPFGLTDSPYPEDLWAWLDETSRDTGADFVAIPHNSNISKGYMFDLRTLRGSAIDQDYAIRRMKWEPIVEITQIKGDSETHPTLAIDDSFADFEEYPYYIQRSETSYQAEQGDYIRSALKRGLGLGVALGVNPYQFGVIGSTDSHTALSSAEEDNFHGKLATDSIPERKSLRRMTSSGSSGWAMSASGLAAVWAEENTRKSILSAMKRREVYATSGPRIGVEFYGGWDLDRVKINRADASIREIDGVVPMGGQLIGVEGENKSPSFVIRATSDPKGAYLDRIQIIKGWIDTEGSAQEKIFDVAWSGGDRLNSKGDLMPVGNTVNIKTASYTNTIGSSTLSAYWEDPEFDVNQPTFYYARILQIPTPRHSLYDAVALGMEHADRFPDTIQERAYTSSIWYRPAGL